MPLKLNRICSLFDFYIYENKILIFKKIKFYLFYLLLNIIIGVESIKFYISSSEALFIKKSSIIDISFF
jgi:hypothetical protein